jgi:hypothetical protein
MSTSSSKAAPQSRAAQPGGRVRVSDSVEVAELRFRALLRGPIFAAVGAKAGDLLVVEIVYSNEHM